MPGQTRSSGFGPLAADVPPPGQIAPVMDTAPAMVAPVPPVPQPTELTQSQQTLPTMTAPPAPNSAPPLPLTSTAQPAGTTHTNGAGTNSSIPAATAKPEYAAIPPPAVVTLSLATTSSAGQVVAISDGAAAAAQKSEEAEKAKQQEELQKKLMEGQEPATIEQQENMQIKGQSARHLVMQKVYKRLVHF